MLHALTHFLPASPDSGSQPPKPTLRPGIFCSPYRHPGSYHNQPWAGCDEHYNASQHQQASSKRDYRFFEIIHVFIVPLIEAKTHFTDLVV